ncbi:MAG TPA: VWA domain-containing protein [Streptosporangiaceae bacterium]|nr:VWA domain-containing protein [Streptosporangiaceae bacterium]
MSEGPGYGGGNAAEGQMVMPFYIICDVSGSMTRDMPLLNEGIQKLHRSIVQNPVVDDVAHVSVIAFSTSARTVMPLSQMSEQPIPTLVTDGGVTNYGKAFRELARAIPQDAALLRSQGFRIFRPCAFFLTDGEPTDRDWLDVFRTTLTFDKNTGAGMKQYPVFIPFGFRDAQEAELRKLAYPYSKGKSYHIKTQDMEQVIGLILDVIMKTVVASGQSSASGKPTLVHAPAPTLPGVTVADPDDDWI